MPLQTVVQRNIDNFSRDTISLRRCYQCGYTPGSGSGDDESRALKRCAGCAQAIYCSAECQRSAWKSHKAECRKIAQESELPDATNLDREAQSVGFSTIAQFSEAIGEFAEAHDFALKNIAKLHVMQHGGNEWSRTPQKLLTFYLESNTSLGSHRNPSRTFKLKGCQFSVLQDIFAQFPPAAADWAQTEPNRNAIQAAYSHKPAFVCILPVRLVVEGVNTGRMLFYPLFRPETSADETPMEKVTILSDVLKWFMGSINAGFPLQLITHADNRVPLPGRFTRSHGSWTWGRFFSDWDEYRRGIHKGLDSAIDDLFLGDTIRPDQLMLFFNLL